MNNSKKYVIISLFSLIAIIYIIRLFYLQVGTDKYKKYAESVLSKREILPAYRGVILDRNNKFLAFNTPVYSIDFIKKDIDERFKSEVCELLNLDPDEYDKKLVLRGNQRNYLPYTFIAELSAEEYATIQDRFDFPGFEIVKKMIRAYPHKSLANTLGYVAEIDKNKLDKDTSGYYRAGDLIGLSGIEKTYEQYLQGKRGVKYTKVDAKRVEVGSFYDGSWDTLPIKGANLKTTIDLDLQEYGELLMQNKIGGIVALDPKDGGVLAMISSPSYDPNFLSGKSFSVNYGELVRDTLTPLYNRAVQASYPPGSIFKLLQTVIALGDGSTNLREAIYCDGRLIGDHAPPGYYNYHRGIMLSSNNYYVKLYHRMLDKDIYPNNRFADTHASYAIWKNYLTSFGLGNKLGIDVANENSGYVPDTTDYDKTYGKKRWFSSFIYSNAIGQGELLVTPLQMANMAAVIANKGYFYTPHIVASINDQKDNLKSFYKKNKAKVQDTVYYTAVIDAMEDVVNRGTARRAITKDLAICGKTGTIENPHGEDHSCFIAFAPKDDPKIAIAVYVENAGYGGTWAGPIASLMMEKYIKGEISDKRKEKRILEKRFINLLVEDE